ncbi:MAG: PTPA-CTERM sorting domain-containing protein [Tildeniella nuda ZEHNDER 1965/U140]|jgi:hypothetical protein|nr:PTPA-CTERM sorting domain-containing protein [Tildeniella nuda ZEHNDER 1965/U140]
MFSIKQFSLSAATIGIATSTVCTVLGTSNPANALSIVDSVNADKSPAERVSWGASEVGWSYTPTFSYDLSGINTKFGARSVGSKTVTVEVYDKAPTTGGTLLRSASFTSLANAFSGGTFTALSLLAGEDYFIGFRDVDGLDVNVTQDAGVVSLPYRFGSSGSYETAFSGSFFVTQPILQFVGEVPTAIPTPALLPGLIGLGLGILRQRKAQAAAVSEE